MTRRHKRSGSSGQPTKATGSPLRMAVATAPATDAVHATLDADLRLLKPALLYADEVTLYSPAAVLLFAIGETASITPRQREHLLRELLPILEPSQAPLVLALLGYYRQLAGRKRGRSRDELIAYLQMKPAIEKMRADIDKAWEEQLLPKIADMLSSSGVDQLLQPMAQGVLVVDPILSSDDSFDIDRFMDAFVERLATLLELPGAYPLFDDQTGSLVRHGIDEGLFAPAALTTIRGKQVAAASGFMSRLPAFTRATIPEILDIRSELHPPLIRFRAAMVRFGNEIEAAAYDAAFPGEVDELFRAEVELVLLDLEERIRSNPYLRELMAEAVGDTKTLLAGALAVGITQSTDLPTLVAGGAAVAQVAAAAAWKRHTQRRSISQHELYFLYRTEELLAEV